MSQGISCKCGEHQKPVEKRQWVVLQRRCNFSAFSGYRYTPSDYSAVQCHVCGVVWRTKAGYVDDLRDGRNKYDIEANAARAAADADEQSIGDLDNPEAPLNKAFPVPALARRDAATTCESCIHCRPRTPKDVKVEAGYDLAKFWCAKNSQPTLLQALRCGGDDYEPRIKTL